MHEIESKEEYEKLCDEIWMHNRLYFQECAPVISDDAFDRLVRLLERTELAHPDWVSPTSPSKRIGEAPLTEFAEVTHAKPMLSLEKAFEQRELEAFYARLEKLVDRRPIALLGQPKIDGLAISVVYEKGCFVRAVTRGNGIYGSDISSNCKTIERFPLRIPPIFDRLEVRGEVFMTRARFQEINLERAAQGLPLFANPRNAAAGALKLLDSRELSKRSSLNIVFYGIAEQNPASIHDESRVASLLADLGLPSFSTISVEGIDLTRRVSSVDEMMLFQKNIASVRGRLPFQIDGVVFKLDSLDESESIQPTNKHPRTAIAWKFESEQAWSVLESITLQVGRTGVVTPVAELHPVELDGSVVRRATLHNMDEIARKDIRVGDSVLVEKSGDVIPRVVMSDIRAPVRGPCWAPPTVCPSCGAELVRDPEEVALRCPNKKGCAEQQIKEIAHFVGKDGLDVEHVGEKLVRHLYERKLISRPSDLFLLTEEALLQLDGVREKSAKNIIQSIEKAKTPALDAFIMALGIRHVGKGLARDIAKTISCFDELSNIELEKLTGIEGVGEKTAAAIYAAVHDSDFQEEITRLKQAGVAPKSIQSPPRDPSLATHPLFGKHLVVTGTLSSMTRSQAIAAIERCGGIVSDTVSKKTNLVVVGQDPGSKAEKAARLNISIIHEPEFTKIVQL